MRPATTAVVIGAGPNGLVAANLLADAGWNVTVLEAQPVAGGAVRSDRSLHPDFVTDWYSAFYPLAAVSPAFAALRLERHGLRWTCAPTVLAHVFPDHRCAVLASDPLVTAASLESFGSGDGVAWTTMLAEFEAIRAPLLDALFTPFPPVRAGVRLARTLGAAELLRFARLAVQPVRSFAQGRFTGDGARALLAGNALHTDLGPEAAGGALYGWLLSMLAQTSGFPVPVGGSGAIVDALVARLRALGGTVRCAAEVRRVVVRDGRATAVRLHDGECVPADFVIADVSAPVLYRHLVEPHELPRRLLADLDSFEWDLPTVKLNWALSGPIPWRASGAAGAGVVHLGADLDGMTRYAADLATEQPPADPFVLLGQMTTADRARSPEGTESVWAYTHLPAGRTGADVVDVQAARVEALLERHAPGFAASVLRRRVQSPAELQSSDANLHGGAVGGGTSAPHQQLFLRPVPGLGRADTPVDGLYLASAGAHPGGGVHGAAGANAAAAALRRAGRAGGLYRRVSRAALRSAIGE